MQYVSLSHSRPGAFAALRPLRGADEAAVDGTGTASAIALLDRLIATVPGAALRPGDAASLAASDRDRLLAALYRETYGDRVESTPVCPSCGTPFDLAFDLATLHAAVEAEARLDAAEPAGTPGAYRLADGTGFRLPTGADECAVFGLDGPSASTALLERCVTEGDPGRARDAVEAALEHLAPLLAAELDARCPECGQQLTLPFDLQRFFLQALINDQPRLAREVHQIARAYGWGHAEILDLLRTQRRRYVELIEDELWRRSRSAF